MELMKMVSLDSSLLMVVSRRWRMASGGWRWSANITANFRIYRIVVIGRSFFGEWRGARARVGELRLTGGGYGKPPYAHCGHRKPPQGTGAESEGAHLTFTRFGTRPLAPQCFQTLQHRLHCMRCRGSHALARQGQYSQSSAGRRAIIACTPSQSCLPSSGPHCLPFRDSKKGALPPIRPPYTLVEFRRNRAENLREERASADWNRQGSWPI
jgi:hypothetical protein